MLVRKIKIIWKRYWSLILNIFRDFFFQIGHFQASGAYKSVAYKSVAYKKSVITKFSNGLE